jgi:heme-degrading monooxygenase HmoA
MSNKPFHQRRKTAMLHSIIQIDFEDYEKWKTVFDEAASLRKSYGSMGVRVFRRVDDSNKAVILGEYEDLDRARQLFQSQEFRDAIQEAGVIGKPEVTFLHEVDQLEA